MWLLHQTDIIKVLGYRSLKKNCTSNVSNVNQSWPSFCPIRSRIQRMDSDESEEERPAGSGSEGEELPDVEAR